MFTLLRRHSYTGVHFNIPCSVLVPDFDPGFLCLPRAPALKLWHTTCGVRYSFGCSLLHSAFICSTFFRGPCLICSGSLPSLRSRTCWRSNQGVLEGLLLHFSHQPECQKRQHRDHSYDRRPKPAVLIFFFRFTCIQKTKWRTVCQLR